MDRACATCCITRDDPRFPQSLLEIPDPPDALWVEGRLELLQAAAIAIVGSRNCTPMGAHDATAFARALSDAGFCVVSGLALGIDAAAHRGALAGPSSSIAVLGTGIDRDYPRRNADLARTLRRDGCVVSEFPPGTAPHRGNFPQRNRLISGLALGVLVVEAACESGSLGTARAAAAQGRDVFALPGSIHSALSKGCHALIRDGAKLAETAQHVLEDLGWKGALHGQASLPLEQAPEPESPVLKALGFAPMSMDQVAGVTGIPVGAIAAELSRLELSRRVRSLPGGWFQRAPPESA